MAATSTSFAIAARHPYPLPRRKPIPRQPPIPGLKPFRIYAKARYYDPETARFLSQDPWSGDVSMPPSLHKYLYAYQNPTVYVDPDGEEPIPAFNRRLTDETFQLEPFQRVNSGYKSLDYAAAAGSSVLNVPIALANAGLNALSLPSRAGAAYFDVTVEEFETHTASLTASTGPAALLLMTGSFPSRLPGMLHRSRKISEAVDTAPQRQTRVVENQRVPQINTVQTGGQGSRYDNAVPDISEAPVSRRAQAVVPNNNTAAIRAEAAANVRQGRQILREARPDLPVSERNQLIRAFDLETFRVNTLAQELTEFRYFDGVNAQLGGRWSTSEWLSTPQSRIERLALPNNNATQAATVRLQPGTTVFQGRVAPQTQYGSHLTGGADQTYNVLGPRAIIEELP
ncbi:hypothetical protein K8B33_15925 [Alcanivorax sp. JB21]|uniref:RHS repeat-associated core domain-containing protein n=1 Tax=Alcanivorax limicola TaxID=2874102 RepID=UPI001CC018F2|nr:RHS repeat-associated core domain-containing protein [Alcanivorax limicola]MBZ2190595.1 hypothetical protein [Alcanivorax limicola]